MDQNKALDALKNLAKNNKFEEFFHNAKIFQDNFPENQEFYLLKTTVSLQYHQDPSESLEDIKKAYQIKNDSKTSQIYFLCNIYNGNYEEIIDILEKEEKLYQKNQASYLLLLRAIVENSMMKWMNSSESFAKEDSLLGKFKINITINIENSIFEIYYIEMLLLFGEKKRASEKINTLIKFDKNSKFRHKERFDYVRLLLTLEQEINTNLKYILKNISHKNYYLLFLLVKKIHLINLQKEDCEKKYQEILAESNYALDIVNNELKKCPKNKLLNIFNLKLRMYKFNALISNFKIMECGREIIEICKNENLAKIPSAYSSIHHYSCYLKGIYPTYLSLPHQNHLLFWLDEESEFYLKDEESRKQIFSFAKKLDESEKSELKLQIFKKCIFFQKNPSLMLGLDILYSTYCFDPHLLPSLNFKKFCPYNLNYFNLTYDSSIESLSSVELSNLEASYWISKSFGLSDQMGNCEMILQSNCVPYSLEVITKNIQLLFEKL